MKKFEVLKFEVWRLEVKGKKKKDWRGKIRGKRII